MRIVTALFLLLFALLDLFAGFGYMLGGVGAGGLLGLIGGAGIGLGSSAATAAELQSTGAGLTVALTVYGAYLLVGGVVLFMGAIFLFSQSRPNFVLLAGIYCAVAELVYLFGIGFGILNTVGLLVGLLAIWQALLMKSVPHPTADGRRQYDAAEQGMVVMIILCTVVLLSVGALYLTNKMHGAVSTEMTVTMKSVAPGNTSVLTIPSGAPRNKTVLTGSSNAADYTTEQPTDAVSGMIKGRPFSLQSASIEKDILKLRQGSGFFASESVTIFLFNDHTLPENKTWEITPETGFSSPHIHINWKESAQSGVPSSDALMSDYDMKLSFGQARNGILPGKISLTLPDKHQTTLEGSFEARIGP